MIEWITVISLILFGVFLLVAEVIFIPGITVVGVIGFIFLLIGIGFGFKYFGSETGWIILGVTGVTSGIIFYYTFKSNFWNRFVLKSSINSKVNEGVTELLKIGLQGYTVSSLKPVGKAEFNGKLYEVKSLGDFINAEQKIKIIRIENGNIFVQPI